MKDIIVDSLRPYDLLILEIKYAYCIFVINLTIANAVLSIETYRV